jgi:adenylate cyclase class 2
MTAPLEREIKLPYASPDAARAAVATLGATPLRPRRLQSDTLFDTPRPTLSPRGAVLRLRRDAERQFVTFKNPSDHPTLKVREEWETSVGDTRVIAAILKHLGFEPWFQYEKFREEFSYGEVVLAIDETPVGTYLEIEGTDAGIVSAAEALGRSRADYVLDSYRALFERDCAARKVPATHMLFPR